MSWVRALSDKLKSMLGFTVYQQTQPGPGLAIDSASVESVRRMVGGEIQPIPWTQTRWYLEDLEEAQALADAGNLSKAAQLYRASRRDGVLRGLLETRTAGVVRLPKRFYGGDARILDRLKSKNGSRSVFDEMCPPGQLAMMTADGIMMGVGIGELVPVVGRPYPVLRRLDPEWLQFNFGDGRWYFVSRAGRLPIMPGDGRWVMHMPYGPSTPWQWGLIWATGRAFINKEHAELTRAGFIAGVANPAKVLQSPSGANEQQRRGIFKHIMEWGPNTALELPPGFEAKLIEVTGQAWQTYQQEVNTCDNEYMVALCGQVVTVTGGTGFANADVHRVIRSDLIQSTAEELAYTVNTQILPHYVANEFGEAAIDFGTSVEWDTSQPKDLEAKTRVLLGVGTGVQALRQAYGDRVDADRIAEQHDVPLLAAAPSTPVGIGAEPVDTADDAIDVDTAELN